MRPYLSHRFQPFLRWCSVSVQTCKRPAVKQRTENSCWCHSIRKCLEWQQAMKLEGASLWTVTWAVIYNVGIHFWYKFIWGMRDSAFLFLCFPSFFHPIFMCILASSLYPSIYLSLVFCCSLYIACSLCYVYFCGRYLIRKLWLKKERSANSWHSEWVEYLKNWNIRSSQRVIWIENCSSE